MVERTKKKNPTGRTMRVATEVARRGTDEIVKAAELVTVRPAKGKSLSLAARRALNLMIQHAAGDAWEAKEFWITKAALRRGHKSNDRIEDLMSEIGTTEVIINTITPKGTPGRLIVPILASRIEEDDETDSGVVWYEFTPKVAAMLRRSETYALLSGKAVLAFESKYSLVLYEIGCQLSGRHNPTQEFTIDALRELIGVPPGKMTEWSDLRRFTLEKAKREIDHLAEKFSFSWEEIREARKGKVVGVKLVFELKPGDLAIAAAEEADRHSAGRSARRAGTVEKIVGAVMPALSSPALSSSVRDVAVKDGFPKGSIRWSEPWSSLAKRHGHPWDIDHIADAFRASPGINATGDRLRKAFVTFCERYAENRVKTAT
jgi:hypothetical protein